MSGGVVILGVIPISGRGLHFVLDVVGQVTEEVDSCSLFQLVDRDDISRVRVEHG